MSGHLRIILAAILAALLLAACDDGGSSAEPAATALPDADNDGIPDIHDNCPLVYNPDQSDAYGRAAEEESRGDVCDDTDGDGLVDARDNCPLLPNPDQANRDGDAYDAHNNVTGGDVCDLDNDNDGVLDRVDACRLGEGNWTSRPDTDNDGDGCRDADEDTDDDNDGLMDSADRCPRGDIGWLATPRTDNDADGCRDAGEDTDDDNDGAPDTVDRCPRGDTDWLSTPRTDNDADGCRDATEDTDDDNDRVLDLCDPTPLNAGGPNDLDNDGYLGDDVDCDGDGLIEISSAAGLNAIRYNPAGTNLTLSAGGAGDSSGCGNATAAAAGPGDLTRCRGYELVADLDLAAAAHQGLYDNWQPIGACTTFNTCPDGFTAVFDGNGHTISNLTIINRGTSYGSGLFGAISRGLPRPGLSRANIPAGEIRNLHIYNIMIQDAPLPNPRFMTNSVYVGGLAGYAAGARLTNCSVTAIAIEGRAYIGGLVGLADEAVIISSYAVVGELSAVTNLAGGLAGSVVGSLIGASELSGAGVSSSYAMVNTLAAGGRDIGGLVGDGRFATINSSYAIIRQLVSPQDQVGGLLGSAEFAHITSSYALSNIIRGRDNVGGLVGNADGARIAANYARTLSIRGNRNVGGLAGRAFDDRQFSNRDSIARSYAIASNINGEQAVGGLVGNATGADIAFSYAMTGELRSAEAPLGGLLGSAANITDNPNYSLVDSYWWQGVGYTAAQNISAANSGRALSLTALQNQTSFAGIYANWNNTASCRGGNDWDLGANTQLPRLNCLMAAAGEAGPNPGAPRAALAAQLQDQTEFLGRHLSRPAMLDDPSRCTGLANINISSLGELQDPRNIFDIYFFYKPVSITDWYSRADLLAGVHASQVKLRLPCGQRYDFLVVGHAANSAVLNCRLLDEVLIEEQQQVLNATFRDGAGPCPATLPYEIEALSEAPFDSFPPRNPTPLADAERVELEARLAAATEVHWYSFTLTRPARVELLTTGNTDTYGQLYRAGVAFPIARDDDSGEQANFMIFTSLRAATYYLRVSASPAAAVNTLGDYRLIFRKDEDGCRSIVVDENDYGPDGADPLEPYQWYLKRHYIYDAWNKVPQARRAGAGIEIAVIDDGLQLNHEDIAANIIPGANLDLSYPAAAELPPSPVSCFDFHGTAVAGIINAVGGNRRGLKGIAHRAKLWAANYISNLGQGGGTDAALRLALGQHRLNSTAVSSNSWGTSPFGTRLVPELPSRPFQQAIDAGLAQGFDGKGISYVFAAGNRRGLGLNANLANYEEHLNYMGIMPVCAVGVDDRVSSFSDAGSNLWVCGYSNSGRDPLTPELVEELARAQDIGRIISPNNPLFHHFGLPTIDLSGDAGLNQPVNTAAIYHNNTRDCEYILSGRFDFGAPFFEVQNSCPSSPPPLLPPPQELPWPAGATGSYSRYFTGTSAAAPAVSGIIALVRAANPELSWREVKLILAGSAWLPEQVRGRAADMNAAPTYHNPSEHYAHHIDYGFGIANASKAIDLALNWTPLPDLLEWDSGRDGDDSGMASANISYQPDSSINITFTEFVNVEIQGGAQNLQPNFGALSIKLISPTGRESVFTRAHSCLSLDSQLFSVNPTEDCPAFRNAFTFGSAAHLGEDPQGDWQLQVNSTANPALDHLQWRLILRGH